MTQARTWIGTWNNPPQADDAETTLRKLFERAKAEYCVGQLEKGEEGTPHLQFVMNFKTPKKLGGLKKLSISIHWEICRSEIASEKYCMKEDTRLEGPW